MKELQARSRILHEPVVDQITYTCQSCCQCQIPITFHTRELREICCVMEITLTGYRSDRVTQNFIHPLTKITYHS